jgi:hypothetical protein
MAESDDDDVNAAVKDRINAVRQIADDDPRVIAYRGFVRLRILARIQDAYPDLPPLGAIDAVEQVWLNIVATIEAAARGGKHVAGSHPAIGKALMDELWVTLFADAATGKLEPPKFDS